MNLKNLKKKKVTVIIISFILGIFLISGLIFTATNYFFKPEEKINIYPSLISLENRGKTNELKENENSSIQVDFEDIEEKQIDVIVYKIDNSQRTPIQISPSFKISGSGKRSISMPQKLKVGDYIIVVVNTENQEEINSIQFSVK